MKYLSRQRGISLVEALVALLVLALGMLSFAALQSQLRRNSDVAKQRSEATRIAQEDMENFRAFGTLAVDGTIANNLAYAQITTGAATKSVLANSVVTTTNATYTVTRAVVDSTVANMKDLRVEVRWVDRNADPQSVIVRSVIAQSDPAVGASLALAPNGSPVRSLLGRDIQVPIPAKDLGNGTSVVKPLSTGTIAFIFDNVTGLVNTRCTGIASTTVTNALDLNAAGVTCNSITGGAYLISGFVRTSLGNSPDISNPNDVAPGGVTMRVDFDNTAPPSGFAGTFSQLKDLANGGIWPAITSGTGTTVGTGTTTYTPAECNAEPLQTVRYSTPVSYTQVNNGVTTTVTTTVVVAIIPQSVTSITAANVAPWVGVSAADAATKIVSPAATGEKFVGYSCLVYPIDLDLNPATRLAYTARLTVWPTSGWVVGSALGEYKVCRYSADYNLNGGVRVRTNSSGVVDETSGAYIKTIDNQEHTYAYLNAQRSLSNQNFLIISARKSTGAHPPITCPTDAAVEVNGQGGENYTDESTVTHQP